MCKVLYIAGYGRSGSTVLDVMLGNHSQIVSAGELTYLLDEWQSSNRHCACGQSYQNCSFWGNLADSVSASDGMKEILRRVEGRRHAISNLSVGIPLGVKDRYRDFHRRLFSYIKRKSGKSIVVDSSKTGRHAPLRFYTLSEIAGLDVYVLHLVRNGQATMDSYVRKGRNWSLEGYRRPLRFPGFRAAVGWTLANAFTIGLAKRYVPSGRYLRVHFEDLVSDPVSIFQRIGDFIEVEMDGIISRVEQGEYFDVGHNVSGNRLRKQSRIRLRTQEKGKREHSLKWYHRLFFDVVGGGLQRYMRGDKT